VLWAPAPHVTGLLETSPSMPIHTAFKWGTKLIHERSLGSTSARAPDRSKR
jgi:hypothetical protein